MKLKVLAIVQARAGSTRLPHKVMKRVAGIPMIELLLKRLSEASNISQIVVATSVNPNNHELADHVTKLGFNVFQGSEDDVLERYYLAAQKFNADVIVRITGDCPLVDANLVDEIIRFFKLGNFDYASNTLAPTFPDGLDVEVFTMKALEKAFLLASSAYDREHVTPFIKNSPEFSRGNFVNEDDYSHMRWTVDEDVDFGVISRVFERFYPDLNFGWKKILEYQKQAPEVFELNSQIMRNEGATMSSGQKLWKRAKRVIPGGNMLLSKRPEMFLPEKWPAYFSRAKGCKVWDLDGNCFTDMSIMGIGTNTLGYGHPEVDAAVMDAVSLGNMSSLNAPEEVYLAEKFIELHPWAGMVRFARSGGEANAIAIRIARASGAKTNVAICGYHGWHDWYLSANLGDDENLSGHLLPGLSPLGVPSNLKGTIFPFEYNDYEKLEKLVLEKNIGVIMMEVMRNMEPSNDFLKKIRKLATEKNIVLIFDECTSGFRETYGGLHKKYGVEPDMAMFGKALGNGYAITAIIGRREVMESAQSTFISSTFWTERLGSCAALATLGVMEKIKSWEIISSIGKDIRGRWQLLADKHELKITHWGLPALAGFTFQGDRAAKYKTLISQEMLKNKFLAGNCVYACVDHTEDVVNEYFYHLEKVFSLISDCERGRNIEDLLEGPVCHSGFSRLN